MGHNTELDMHLNGRRTPHSPAGARMCVLLGALVLVTSRTGWTADYTVWMTGSMEKVFRDRAFQPPRVLPDDGMKLYAARNEHVAGQLVIAAGVDPLANVMVTLSPLRAAGGEALPASAFSLLRVGYVHLPLRNMLYPDPMPPLKPCDVPARSNQPVWVACVVPKGTASGIYEGSLMVSVDNAPTKTAPISIEGLERLGGVRLAFMSVNARLDWRTVHDRSVQPNGAATQ